MVDTPTPPSSTGTWGESVETRLAFVEGVIRAGHAVGQQPGTAPTPPVPAPRSAQESAAGAAAYPLAPTFPATTFPTVKP
jgi:hypothetical protein